MAVLSCILFNFLLFYILYKIFQKLIEIPEVQNITLYSVDENGNVVKAKIAENSVTNFGEKNECK